MVTVHTSPLAQPGTGDAGGMNVYVLEVARQLARRGVAVDLFTRKTSASQPDVVEVEPGVIVRHVAAGPYEGLSKEDLPGQLCAFAAGMMRVAAHAPPGYYDLVHSHYWLSGQVGWLAADRWGVPLVHTMHTMARVKNLHLADGDEPEPRGREIGEAQVVEAADRPGLRPAVIVVAVGLHFLPFAAAFHTPMFTRLGTLMALIGAIGVGLGWLLDPRWAAAAAVLTGVVMLVVIATDAAARVRPARGR